MSNYLRQGTAVTLVIGQFLYYLDAKTLLYLAVGNDNANFDVSKLVCYLTKGITQSVLTLTKTGGDNDMNLLPDSQATLELTALDTDTCGPLKISFVNSTPGDELILEGKVYEFFVVPSKVYDILVGISTLLDELALQATLLSVKGQTDRIHFDSSEQVLASVDQNSLAKESTVQAIKEQTDKMEFDSSGAIRDQEVQVSVPEVTVIEHSPATELNPVNGTPAVTQSTTVILGG